MSEVRLESITKRFGGQIAVEQVSLHVREGEFVTLLGPSGCGKTTALRCLAGFETPDEGRVFLGNRDVTGTPARERGVGIVFQSYALFPNMTAWDNIAFGLKMANTPAAEARERVQEVLDAVHLTDAAQKYPSQLSGGMQQRVALARALVRRPAVLLLDEPLSALDAKIRVQLRHLIKDLQAQWSITTLAVTHDQEEALEMSDRIAVMQAGRIVQVGTPHEIYSRPATRFVAGFVGTLNFLPADVAPDRAVRPEAVQLHLPGQSAPAADSDYRLAGTVIRATLLGTIIRVRVQVGATELVADVLNQGDHAERWHAGLAVEVRIPAAATFPVAS